jgi:hypothetical protein
MKSLIDKDNKDFSVVELKGKKYSLSKLGSQVDIYAVATRAIGEYVGKEFGHEMRMLAREQHLQLEPLMPT